MDEARLAAASLGAAIQTEAEPVIDASGLQTLDSAAVAVLLQCQRVAALAGKTLQITGAPPKLGRLARLYGVAELLRLA